MEPNPELGKGKQYEVDYDHFLNLLPKDIVYTDGDNRSLANQAKAPFYKFATFNVQRDRPKSLVAKQYV